MFGRSPTPTAPENAATKARLKALLRDWKTPEPTPDFNAAVWRRIRATPAPLVRIAFADLVRQWIVPHPVWTGAVATTAALIAGVFLGVSLPAAHPVVADNASLLHNQTLAGSYLAMVSGDAG
jgi:hypothetical protein